MATRSLRSPLVRTVVSAVQKLYPLALADKSWDNTGLLLEAPARTDKPPPPQHIVLLTIDLTRAVVEEALSLPASMIVSYHPPIFRGLKALTLDDPLQESLLRLTQAGVSVYSPHTAVDAVVGGVNEWLCSAVDGDGTAEKKVLVPTEAPPAGFEGAGMGRLLTLKTPVALPKLVEGVKSFLGLPHLLLSAAPAHLSGTPIRTIAVCAGSGGSLFKSLTVDLLFTGELSHHEALAARERGTSTLCCFHTNTERGFLRAVMQAQLQGVLAPLWAGVDVAEKDGVEKVEVRVSAVDRDPYEIV